MERQERATELFLACCDKAPADRAAFLAVECGGDRELRAVVEGMLAVDERVPEFLAGRAGDALRADEGEPPRSIGRFRILRKLGAGGMGAVYEAEQENPRRKVALKVLRSLLLSPQAQRRFEHEGQFLGRLQHPGIAQVFEVGRAETADGPLHYLAMELVEGETLTGHATRRGLSLRRRLELFTRVADAVQHAHQHSVIHRDLKPSNILVTESGQPKVLDFGIARASEADVKLTTLETDFGQVLGTLAYMSPEQASGDPSTIDSRSDVYSLGVLLYELVADRLPYDVSSKSLPEAVRIIQEELPRPLSASRGLHKGDLETIVGAALEKDKERRYASAAALATDIHRFLHDEPIAARPPSRTYILRKFFRRHRALTVAGGMAVLSLAVGFVVSTHLFIETKAALSDARWGSYRGNLLAAAAEMEQGNYWGARQRLEECPEEHRGWEWHHAKLALDPWLQRLDGHGDVVSAVSVSRDGTHMATASAGELILWDATSGALVASLDPPRGSIWSIASIDVGPLGRVVVFSHRHSVYLWEPREASPPFPLREQGMGNVRTVRLGPDATWFANGSKDGVVRVWNTATREVRARLVGHKGIILGLDVSPDGERIASSSEADVVLRLWEVVTGTVLREIRVGKGLKCVAFSSDGKRLATGNSASAIAIWEVDTGKELRTIPTAGSIVTSVAFNRDGTRIVSGDWEGLVRIWNTSNGTNLWNHGGHERNSITGVAVAAHPDGRFLTSGYDHAPRLWSFEAEGTSTVVADFPDPTLTGVDRRPAQARAAKMTPDGKRIVAEVGGIHVWSAEAGAPLTTLAGLGEALSPDGRRVATIRPGRILDLETGEEIARLRVTADSLAFSPDGLQLLAGDSEEPKLHVLDGTTGELRGSLSGGSGPPRELCVGSDGTVFSASGRTIDLWDPGAGHLGSLAGHEGQVFGLAVVPGRRLLVSASNDGSIRVWDTAGRRSLQVLRGQGEGVRSLAVSPDGTRIASGASDGRVRIWSLQRGDLLVTLTPPSDREFFSPRAVWVAFSPDGRRLLTSRTGTIRIWESERTTARTWWEGVARRRRGR